MKRAIWLILGTLGLGAFLLPFTLPHPARVWVLSVGQGESVLYQDTRGQYLLFDGGPDSSVLSELGRILPPWHRRIDVIALSHLHADHLRGLIAVLNKYEVGTIWENGVDAPGNDVAEWRKLIKQKHIPEVFLHAGFTFELGDTHILTLHPIEPMEGKRISDQNDGTVVLQLLAEGQRLLLTGDLDETNEQHILDWCQPPTCSLASDILQIPHHGSASGLSPPFLAAVHPKLAFISVGQNNQFKHPRAVILERLSAAHIPYHRTDTQGGLRITLSPGKFVYEKTGSAPR